MWRSAARLRGCCSASAVTRVCAAGARRAAVCAWRSAARKHAGLVIGSEPEPRAAQRKAGEPFRGGGRPEGRRAGASSRSTSRILTFSLLPRDAVTHRGGVAASARCVPLPDAALGCCLGPTHLSVQVHPWPACVILVSC